MEVGTSQQDLKAAFETSLLSKSIFTQSAISLTIQTENIRLVSANHCLISQVTRQSRCYKASQEQECQQPIAQQGHYPKLLQAFSLTLSCKTQLIISTHCILFLLLQSQTSSSAANLDFSAVELRLTPCMLNKGDLYNDFKRAEPLWPIFHHIVL